jgi:serpin B
MLQQAFVTVDEAGAEAAAATAMMFAPTDVDMRRPQQVAADRPFLYVVHDWPTGTPLFVGRVLAPAG